MSLPSSQEFLPHIAYDSVVFGFSGQQLKILLMEYRNTGWFALPGGFVRRNEDLDTAVQRGLQERTGLSNVFLEQFHTFGKTRRYDSSIMKTILEAGGHEIPDDHWMLDRFLSVAYYALIDYGRVSLKPDTLSDSIDWYPVDGLPELIFDHESVVQKALETLRNSLHLKRIGMNLMPQKFTMRELQIVHEAILGAPIRRTTFQRKMLSLGILERHEKQYNGKAHKAPYLYSFLPTEP